MLVSVVIPTFNRRTLVREAVISVAAQSGVDYELVVVDDGSTDGTAASLRAEFGGLVRLVETPNRGVAAARNAGVAASGGDWVAFLDSDDLWLPQKLAAQVDFLSSHRELRICQTEETWIRDGVRVNPCAHHRKPAGDIFVASLRLCLVSPSAVLLHRGLFDRIGGFDPSLPACEDYDLWLRIARTEPVGLVERPLVVKRGGHRDQLSRRFWGMDRFRVAALSRLLANGDLTDAQRGAARDVLKEKCAILSHGAARRGRLDEAERYAAIAAAFDLSPARATLAA